MATIDWKNAPSFIETQFPVSKLSKESYKERKSNYSQTLTGLGKWWGRKPLILIRATILGLLLPATGNPRRDREVFLALLTMDDEGLSGRRAKSAALSVVFEGLTVAERGKWFETGTPPDRPKLKRGLSREDREALQELVFSRMTYDEKLEYCERPENVQGPSEARWRFINAHLGTSAASLSALVEELGRRRFGRVPRVGDVFCGGGSLPFEASRIGCVAYGSDLNPVAALLSWASLNVVGADAVTGQSVQAAQRRVYDAVDAQITAWGIEHNAKGWRADAYLYCVETTCPECGWRVPLAPSWIIGEKTMAAAVLHPEPTARAYRIEIETGLTAARMEAIKHGTATMKDAKLICPNCEVSTPLMMLRGDRRAEGTVNYGLRMWSPSEVEPAPGDVFGERLYCVRWVETYRDDAGVERTRRHYREVGPDDLEREERVRALLRERFGRWRETGIIPRRAIATGKKTDELIRNRGWTHWHQLFTPRQLLLLGSLSERIHADVSDPVQRVGCVLGLGRAADYNARLSRWHAHGANEKVEQVFSDQVLNPLVSFGSRAFTALETCFLSDGRTAGPLVGQGSIAAVDARRIGAECDIWVTDPPYADAVMYHELTEFPLAWYESHISTLFPEWPSDTRRALAVTGSAESFKTNMVACYRAMASRMPANGFQVVMFTHQDASVWADLAVILWAAGLAVASAWCLVTETDTALKEGNYVQGTVLLVLRKQTSDETAFLDEVHPQVEDEVRAQLGSMLALEDADDPNFGDSDYQLAAYAAALRVLTRYKGIEDINVEDQLTRVRQAGERNPVEDLIADAVRTACDFLIPKGFSSDHWKQLGPEERLYLKALEVETHGEHRSGVYQELARGFRVKEYKGLIETAKANLTRLKTASEFGARELGTAGFGSSTMRALLFGVRETVRAADPQVGKSFLREGLPDYWPKRVLAIAVLDYLSNLGVTLPHWAADAEGARLLAGALRNDSV